MPTMTETEGRLRSTLQAVASTVPESEESTGDVAAVPSPLARPPGTGRNNEVRRRSPLLVFAASFIAVLLVGAVSILTDRNEPGEHVDRLVELGSSGDPEPVTTDRSPADGNSLEPSAAGVFWAQVLAGRVDTVSRMDTFGPDQPEPEARLTESRETDDPFGDGGSIVATVVTADGQVTVRAEYRGRGEAVDETALDAEIAKLTADGTVQHIDTIWHGYDMESALGGEGERAEYFLTGMEPGSTRLTVLTVWGRLEMDVDTNDPALLLDTNQLMGIATGVVGTSLDLTRNPDHPLSTVVEPLPEPADNDWVALDDDLWVASVSEGASDQLWVKSDIQDPTSAPSTDTRSLYVYAGSDFVVIVVGEPVPDTITVVWEDGSSDAVEPTWNTEVGMGIARFDDKAARVVSVDGP